jgi:hypothetical protein
LAKTASSSQIWFSFASFASFASSAHNNAIREWEQIPGGVSIAGDIASTYTDLELRDYSANDGRCGFWDASVGADVIKMNRYYMDDYSVRNREACTLHEWGHAHRLAHSYSDQAMDDCPVSSCGSTYITPQNHDRSDYNGVW